MFTINRVRATPHLSHLQIYDGDVDIGDYERSSDVAYDAKEQEALGAAPFLKQLYLQYGRKIVVRWNADRKEVREYQANQNDPGSNSHVLGEIPRSMWRR